MTRARVCLRSADYASSLKFDFEKFDFAFKQKLTRQTKSTSKLRWDRVQSVEIQSL